MSTLQSLTDFNQLQFAIVSITVLLAGVVRGFSGFALSALVIASLAIMIPPIELIAICWILELSASFLMIRGGFGDGDKKIAIGLSIGSVIGAPIGLWLTTSLPATTSKMVALIVIAGLAGLLLAKIKATFLATRTGLYISGVASGVVSGLAGVGGMVVALYVLARDAPAREMRGSLVLYLFLSTFISFVNLSFYGLFNQVVVARGLVLAVPCILGVVIGKAIFRPAMEKYYRPFCLTLLLLLAGFGIVRLVAGI